MPLPARRRAFAPRWSVVAAAVVALVLAPASPAAAHSDRGVAGSDYAGQVLSISAPMPGVSLIVTEFGDSLQLLNGSDVTVTVYGYSDEEYLRIGPEGVWRNANSPATYLNIRRDGDMELPPNAQPDAEPDWRQVSTQPRYTWHDHRTHWMLSSLPPQVAAAPTREHTVIEWEVPVAYGDTDVRVAGELTWAPPPRASLWWPGYLLIPALGLLAGARGRTARPLAALATCCTVAAFWHVMATPQSGLTATDRLLALGAASLPTLVVVALTGSVVHAALRGRPLLAAMLSAVVGFLLLVQGLPDMDVLWSAHAITAGPVVVARLTIALLIFGGIGLLLGSAAAVRRFRPPVVPGTHLEVREPATAR